MKFGGTSVGSAERMKASAALIAAEAAKRPVVAVVSAMSKITDLLLEVTRHAEAEDDAGMERGIGQLRARHREAAEQLLPAGERAPVLSAVEELISEFQRITSGRRMLGHRPPRAVDEAIAIGERLSIQLVAAWLRSTGVRAEAVNAAELVVTDAVFNNASPLMAET